MTSEPNRTEAGEQTPRIAIVGMAGRFPGARDVQAFWRNLREGFCAVRQFADDALLAAGCQAAELDDPSLVKAGIVLDDVDRFDASFFDISPREAEIMDPQMRLTLEVAWHALEHAGYGPGTNPPLTGVFMGATASAYLIRNLGSNRDMVDLVGGSQVFIRNDKDFIPTTVSHKLNLLGPSMNISTACSTSLVAAHVAAQHLLTYQCDLALAGGASIHLPQGRGYRYQKEGIYSPDGFCRPFSADAAGTVGGSGVAMVVLKRWEDAVADGDTIYATILASAVNNDGQDKVGYTAPGIRGQRAVIEEALAVADVPPHSIDFIETHGTGTHLGDPIEVAALTGAFGAEPQAGSIALGSLKSNVGHLDAAAGVAGLIKASLALHHRELPPSLHFTRPNPEIDFENGPFFVNTALRPLDKPSGEPLRAGVSAFGIGGTNAHLILEASDSAVEHPSNRDLQLLLISAHSPVAREGGVAKLAQHLRRYPDTNLADASFTLARGRAVMTERAFAVAGSAPDAAAVLTEQPDAGFSSGSASSEPLPLVWMFPGQGAQYPGMAAELYRCEALFQEPFDRMAGYLSTHLDADVSDLLVNPRPAEDAGDRLAQTALAQPALFLIGYALARFWQALGLEPRILLGHSIGELTAATLAGVFDERDAARLVCARGRLMQACEPGAMTAVGLGPDALVPKLQGLALAAVNGPEKCVVSGPEADLAELETALQADQVSFMRLHTSHAFHSAAMEPAAAAFAELLATIPLKPPTLPILSNRDGAWLSAEEATDPNYWAAQLRGTVRFAGCLATLSESGPFTMMELGPGHTLSKFADAYPGLANSSRTLPTLAGPRDKQDTSVTLNALGHLWLAGYPLDWQTWFRHETRRRIPLPGYAFQRDSYWIEERSQPTAAVATSPVWPALAAQRDHLQQRERVILEQTRVETFDDVSGLVPALDAYCAELIYSAWLAAGIDPQRDSGLSENELANRLAVRPPLRKYLQFMIQTLAEDGWITVVDETIRFPDPARRPRLDMAERLRADYPRVSPLLDILTKLGPALPEVLSQPHAGLRLLYPEGADEMNPSDQAGDTYFHIQVYIRLAVETIVEWARQAPRPPRILEVGMGSGMVTWELVQQLTAQGISFDYTATDLGPSVVAAGRDMAARRGISSMDFAVLDLREDLVQQGFDQASFDLALGLDVVHVMPDLAAALNRLTRLMAPGGLVAVIESVRTNRWSELIWGVTEGWWQFEDSCRPHSPIASIDVWETLFQAAGFAQTAAFPAGKDRQVSTAALFIGQMTGPTLGLAPNADQQQPISEARAVDDALGIPDKRDDITQWFYVPSWQKADLSAPPAGGGEHVLVFCDASGLGSRLARHLRQSGHLVLEVAVGNQFRRVDELRFEIDPTAANDYHQLVQSLSGEDAWPGRVFHCWTAEQVAVPALPSRLQQLDAQLDRGLFSLLFWAQAMGQANLTRPQRLAVISRGTQSVDGGETLLAERATVWGAVKMMPQEYPNLTCAHIDLALHDGASADADSVLLEALAHELSHEPAGEFVAFRNGSRLVKGYVSEPIETVNTADLPLREQGVYVISGGFGGVGLTLAAHLAEQYRARLVLIGRTGLPARDQWPELLIDPSADPRAVEKIRQVQAMEHQGAQVWPVAADITDEAAMQNVFRETLERFGAIHGIVQTTAVMDEGGVMQRRNREETYQAMASKVRGTLVLDHMVAEFLAPNSLDFMVLCAALGGILHQIKFGEMGYVAANDFLDAFSHERNGRYTTPTIAIDWTDWLEVGMSAEAFRKLDEKEARCDGQWPLPAVASDGAAYRFQSGLTPAAVWVLGEHKIGGVPTLPGTAYIDLIAAVARSIRDDQPGNVQIRDLYFARPCQVPEGCVLDLRVEVHEDGEAFRAQIEGRLREESVEAWQTYASCRFEFTGDDVPLADREALARRSAEHKLDLADNRLDLAREVITLGPRWASVERVQFGDMCGLATLALNSKFNDDLDRHPVHPALLDTAVAFLNHYLLEDNGLHYLPVGYHRIKLYGTLPARIHSFAECRGQAGDTTLSFDIQVFDDNDRLVAEIEGLTIRLADTEPARASAENYALTMAVPGDFRQLYFEPSERREPALGEVEIEAAAFGLNFKEVLTASGLLPVLVETPSPFGCELAGRIVRVGEDVTGLAPGDAVLTFGAAWTCPYATVPVSRVMTKPPALTFEEAAGIGVAYSTAYHALITLADLKPSDTVLIHAATGGVGLAAVHVAKAVGATILATAGRDEKRSFLRDLGISHVFSSRDNSFVEGVRQATAGRGADVVLNSLGGDLMQQSLALTARFGRFVEIGQKDYVHGGRLDLTPFLDGLTYFSVVMDDADPRFQATLRACDRELTAGTWPALPLRTFPMTDLSAAFDWMAAANHIGKVVLTDITGMPVDRPAQVAKQDSAGKVQESDFVRGLVKGMTRLEGIEVFRRILARPAPQILTSTQDLDRMFEEHHKAATLGQHAFLERDELVKTKHPRAKQDVAYAAPSTDTEIELAEIWESLLGIEQMGVDDDFFRSGGDSLIAIRMLSRLQETFAVELTLAALFELPTIAKLAERIDTLRWDGRMAADRDEEMDEMLL